MKKLRLLTVSTLLLAGSMATFTSCGGGESDESDKKGEEKTEENGYAIVKQMMDAFDKGDLVLEVSDADEVKKVMDIDSDDEDYISIDKEFKGYDFDVNFSMEDGALSSVSCNTFYDDDKEDEAKEDSEELLAYLKKTLGDPESDSDTYFDWSYAGMEVSFSIYEDGYSLYIDPSYEEPIGGDYDGDCVGDFYNLKKDLSDLFLANVKNGKIKLGSTTKSEMASLVGSSDGYDKEYDGLRVSGYFSYEGDVLSSISLDYFYDCDGALSLLDMDKEDITEEINTGLGVTGEKDGDYEDAGTNWTINGMSVRQANFSDGYSVYFDM